MSHPMLQMQSLHHSGPALLRVAGRATGRAARLAGLAGALAILSACSVLPKAETLEIYRLPPASIASPAPSAPSAPANSLLRTLRIATPHSSQAVDSVRILVLQDNRISAYKGVRWSDPAPVLLRNRLASAFRADGRFGSVSSGNDNLPASVELGGDLGAFQVEYRNGMPAVSIRFYATLMQSGGNRILAARSFEVSQPVEGKTVPEVMTAFGKAADKLASQVIEWTLQNGSALQPGTE